MQRGGGTGTAGGGGGTGAVCENQRGQHRRQAYRLPAMRRDRLRYFECDPCKRCKPVPWALLGRTRPVGASGTGRRRGRRPGRRLAAPATDGNKLRVWASVMCRATAELRDTLLPLLLSGRVRP